LENRKIIRAHKIRKKNLIIPIIIFSVAFWILKQEVFAGFEGAKCLGQIPPSAAIILADHDGKIIFKQNEALKYVPASSLKLLTALSAIHYLGESYRFKTNFYVDRESNLKIKGFGDPLLISEIWKEIAYTLANKVKDINNLILDDSYFSSQIKIPGRGNSTNPYDAPVGALCANFNTILFKKDKNGEIISAEPETPLIPFARKKAKSLGLKRGRYTFSHNRKDSSRYAGELLLHFLIKNGVSFRGNIKFAKVLRGEKPLFTYHSRFTTTEIIRKMLKFSNNFLANQLFISMGAHFFGSPGTLEKAKKTMSRYVEKHLDLKDVEIVEASGISRKNRMTALDMLSVLKNFMQYRHLLTRRKTVLYKTGTLRGIRTRVGYIEKKLNEPYYFVIFLTKKRLNVDYLVECMADSLVK